MPTGQEGPPSLRQPPLQDPGVAVRARLSSLSAGGVSVRLCLSVSGGALETDCVRGFLRLESSVGAGCSPVLGVGLWHLSTGCSGEVQPGDPAVTSHWAGLGATGGFAVESSPGLGVQRGVGAGFCLPRCCLESPGCQHWRLLPDCSPEDKLGSTTGQVSPGRTGAGVAPPQGWGGMGPPPWWWVGKDLLMTCPWRPPPRNSGHHLYSCQLPAASLLAPDSTCPAES